MIRVGFDVGGTFTDFVLQTDDGRLHTTKRLTTYPDPSDACLSGLDAVIGAAGVDWTDVAQAVHGTTLGSNLVIERKGTDVALVTTRGFRDVLVIGREKRYQVYNLQISKPEPLVDRAHIHEVGERTLADGGVREPLDEDEVRALLRRLVAQGITSVAVCFLHSYANPDHERRFAALAAEEAPEVVVSLSSDVSPQFREYERTSTTLVNAYLVRAVGEYLERMTTELRDRGYGNRLFIMQSGGGIAEAATMAQYPVRMIESGPAAGALIAARYGRSTGHLDLVAFDMGGTTAKLSLIDDGRPETIDAFELHQVDLTPGSGIPITVQAVDLVEIGAGGGSIARAETGTISVGPDSAGSDPGPVCYGRGGTRPTVTDANLVLGYLNPHRFASGTITLDVEAAAQAIRRDVADPLGLELEDAAWGIHRIVNLNMELATRVVSIERGHDPRELALVATGGSGPAHGARLASALGIGRVILPAAAGVASAVGLLAADVKFTVSRSLLVRLDEIDLAGVNEMLEDMESEVAKIVAESTGRQPMHILREAEVRYVGQGYTVTTRVPSGRLDADRIKTLRTSFDDAYRRLYGYANPTERAEATTWRLTAHGEGPTVEFPRYPRQEAPVDDAIIDRRRAYFPERGGYVDTPIYDRDLLAAGARFEGPAIIEERESTTVLPPDLAATVDEHRTIIAEIRS